MGFGPLSRHPRGVWSLRASFEALARAEEVDGPLPDHGSRARWPRGPVRSAEASTALRPARSNTRHPGSATVPTASADAGWYRVCPDLCVRAGRSDSKPETGVSPYGTATCPATVESAAVPCGADAGKDAVPVRGRRRELARRSGERQSPDRCPRAETPPNVRA
ncbi:hypothetical protein GCM10028793_36620 [Nocardiopsis oceani]